MKVKSFVWICLLICFAIGCVGNKKSEESTMAREDNQIREWFEQSAKQMNAQCPIRADEITTFQQVLLCGKTMMIKTQIPNEYVDEIDFGVFQRMKCENYSKLLDKKFVEFIRDSDYAIQYVIFDELGRAITKVDILGEDILEYY